MCDSFDMACRDASNALQLNIKVNSENLLPNAQKYNVGSLRIPADPSWPKIPQRKLAEDMDDVIVPPCVVTLTGTPRKSRTTVRHANSHQSSAIYSKDHVPASLHPSIYQKTSHLGHPMKRRPGCADPRFKKVTTVKSQMTSTEPPDRERDNHTELSRSAVIISNQIQSPSEDVRKIIPEKDNEPPRVTQQEAEKPGEIRGMDSVGVQTTITEDPTLLTPDKTPNDVSLAITNKLQDSAKLTSAIVKAKKLDSPTEAVCKGEKSFRREWSPDGGKKYAEPEVQKKYVEPEVQGKYVEPEVQRKYDEPEVQGKYAEPEVQGKYAEPEVQGKYAEPEVHKKYAEPEVQGKYAEPEVHKKYAEPEVNKKYAEPEVHKKYAEPEVNKKYAEPEVHKKCAEPEVQGKYAEPEVHKKYAEPEVRKKNVAKEERASPNLTTGNPPAESPCLQCCQVKNAGQLLFVVESKGQGSPLGTIQIDTSSMTSCQYTSQCYNVQVPVLSYQNLPLQISTQQTAKSEIPSQLSLSPVLTIPSQASLNHPHHHHHHHHHQQQQRHHHDTTKGNFSRLSEVPESPMCKEETCESSSRISQNEEKSLDYCDVKVSRKLLVAPSARLDRKQETSFNCHDVKIQSDGISENYKAPRAQQLMSDTTDSEAYGLDVKLYSKETSASGSDYETKERRFAPVRDTSQTRKKRNYFTNEKEGTTKEFKFSRVNRKMKSEQNLPRSTLTKNYKNISEPQISGRDVYPLAIDDSENLPDSCDTQRTDLTNVVGTTKATMSPTTNDIPVKTQQLLNKSYMEYYDKLRSNYYCGVSQQRYTCQIAMGASNVKKRRADISSDATNVIAEEKDTKIEALNMEKLSALSNIINCNLNPALRNASEGMQTKQLYVNENMKGSSDPTAVTQSALVAKKLAIGNSADLYDSSVASSALLNKLKRKREKPVERRLLKLKSIAFFGFMMYAMIVFLPMMYTYFLYDDYEDYEDLSYIELLLDYVVSSFREAFGGFFDLIREMFFRPVSLD